MLETLEQNVLFKSPSTIYCLPSCADVEYCSLVPINLTKAKLPTQLFRFVVMVRESASLHDVNKIAKILNSYLKLTINGTCYVLDLRKTQKELYISWPIFDENSLPALFNSLRAMQVEFDRQNISFNYGGLLR